MGGVGTDRWILPILKKKTEISVSPAQLFSEGLEAEGMLLIHFPNSFLFSRGTDEQQ